MNYAIYINITNSFFLEPAGRPLWNFSLCVCVNTDIIVINLLPIIWIYHSRLLSGRDYPSLSILSHMKLHILSPHFREMKWHLISTSCCSSSYCDVKQILFWIEWLTKFDYGHRQVIFYMWAEWRLRMKYEVNHHNENNSMAPVAQSNRLRVKMRW